MSDDDDYGKLFPTPIDSRFHVERCSIQASKSTVEIAISYEPPAPLKRDRSGWPGELSPDAMDLLERDLDNIPGDLVAQWCEVQVTPAGEETRTLRITGIELQALRALLERFPDASPYPTTVVRPRRCGIPR